ncbi:MAG TPA: ABC transporter ATP-binding protein [Nocardioidaceae bacterium]|nr:ABC transporter ATP-binding protein [Nocardioidaceae bacterium]
MLSVSGVSAWYGEAQVLDDVSLDVEQGQIVTLVGRNGAGKTTLLRCLMGLHRAMSGRIELDGADISRKSSHQRARLGLGYVPDDRGIYASLSVEENLLLPPTVDDRAWSVEQVYEAFPVLADRRRQTGTHLSGGEQQMLSLARVLRTGARMLLADEPTEGLSPLLVQQIGDIFRNVREHGITVLLIEQNLHFASTLADRHHLIARGQVVESLDNSEVKEREHELLEYLGI